MTDKTTEPAAPDLSGIEPVTMEDAIAAGDGTLHGAIDYWQEQASQLAAMTQERDAERRKHEECVTINERLLSDIRCSQAREQKLREALKGLLGDTVKNTKFTDAANKALSLPQDDTALHQYVKQEQAKLYRQSGAIHAPVRGFTRRCRRRWLGR